jgi:hypothetical protein
MRGAIHGLMLAGAVAALASEASAESSMASAPYVGGRGLISLEGQTGLTINPTSGTAPEGSFSPQYCALIQEVGGDQLVGHGFLATYGVTDWLEVGGYGLLVTDIDASPTNEFNIGTGQGNVRVRLLKDQGWIPEISVGGNGRFGNDRLERHTIWVAASKGFKFGDDLLISGIRFHAGFRQFWQDNDFNERDGSIGFVGGELELPLNLYLTGEVSNRGDVFAKTPYSVGVQWRDPRGYGLTLAAVQPGGADHTAIYVGIGVNF